jgi:YfiH family protein
LEQLFSSLLNTLDWLEHGFGSRNSPLPQGDRMATLKQVHSATVLTATTEGCVGEGDALITDLPGLSLAVRTADCLPILLVDPRNRAIAAVHSGWRGTVAGVAVNALNKMQENYKTNPFEIVAAIGPGIGPCCYEVGPEVAAQFGLVGRTHLNLADAKRTQLVAAGIPDSQIEMLPYCTKCRADLFHSFRRDHAAAGRMISFIRKVY